VYERARPGYPAEAAAWLVGGDRPRRVVDLGAGTGKLTRVLAGLGHDVVAVEPLGPMRAQLLASVPGIECVEGSAERIPLPEGSADAVVAAQAFHWFDAPVALAEIARVLRPGGALGLVWNARDEAEPWVARLSALLDESAWVPLAPPEIAASGLYGEVESETFRHAQRLDRDLLVGLVASRSLVATMGADERAQLLVAVGAVYDEAAGAGGLTLPYVAHAFRARRL
jgi:SAM-dependent methyltransferase